MIKGCEDGVEGVVPTSTLRNGQHAVVVKHSKAVFPLRLGINCTLFFSLWEQRYLKVKEKDKNVLQQTIFSNNKKQTLLNIFAGSQSRGGGTPLITKQDVK